MFPNDGGFVTAGDEWTLDTIAPNLFGEAFFVGDAKSQAHKKRDSAGQGKNGMNAAQFGLGNQFEHNFGSYASGTILGCHS